MLLSKYGVLIALAVCHLIATDTPPSLDARQDAADDFQTYELRTPVEDELLRGLETSFVALAERSRNRELLFEAEQLLAATNNNSRWTNYSKATKLLRDCRDKAGIPLLLWYMVEHAERSSAHVMIPEYRKTITLLSGHELESVYESGPDLPDRMRKKVQGIVNDWWLPNKATITVDASELSDEQLKIIVTKLLEEIRDDGDFNGSGGRRDTAYGVYHNVLYDIPDDSSSYEKYHMPEIHPGMLNVVLDKYRDNEKERQSQLTTLKRFPYEAVIVLAELAKNGQRQAIADAAVNTEENSTIRLAAILSLFRAGEEFRTDEVLELVKDETLLEKRLIMLSALRWGDEKAVPILLQNMDDPNIEIATAAACALSEAKPAEAVPKFEKLLNRKHRNSPVLLLDSLASYKTAASRELLETLLRSAVDGGDHAEHLDRILYAFVEACNLERPDPWSQEMSRREQAILVLAAYESLTATREAEMRKLTALVASTQQQLDVARKVEELRRAEYKRLLHLQGDDIITAEQSEVAASLLKTSEKEVETLREELNRLRAEYEAKK